MPIYKMEGKKDGKQKYRVRINYQDSTGQPKQIDRVAYGMAEAKELEKNLMQNLNDEIGNKNITVSQLHDEYNASRTKSVRESTAAKSKQIIDRHIIPTFGTVKLHRLTVPLLQKWKNGLDALDLSLITKQNIYKAFRALLNYAVKMEYIPQNPLLKVGNFKDALAGKSEMDFYTTDEYKLFISAAKDFATAKETSGDTFEWNYYVFFAIAFYTGMRKGEINGLMWSDIDGEHISVKRSVAQKLKGGDRITPPKNKSSIRTLQMPKPLIDILAAHKNRCERIDGFNEQRFICGVFKPLRDSTIEKRNKLYARTAEIKKIRIHDFRHSHASLLANEGINIQEIARRLGHSKVEITWNTYSHLYPREEERAVQILDKIIT